MIGKLKDMTFNGDGTQNITITVGADFREAFDRLKDSDIRITIQKAGNPRTSNQNRYLWDLIDEIAAETHRRTTEIYRDAIRDIGGISSVVGVKDEWIEEISQAWEKGHLGRQAIVVPGSSKIGWSNVRLFLGSSDFDTIQMARMLDIIIQDAEALGIPTLNEKQIEKYYGKWGLSNEVDHAG